jgi:phosphoribosylaminoimidazole-succinocarboxamide synthase
MMETDTIYMGRREKLGPYRLLNTGKVRDIYEFDPQHLLFVTSDRISAFDVMMPRGIPHKGRVLTSIAAHWFGRTSDLIANHLVATDVDELTWNDDALREELRGRIMLVRRCEPTTVEWVVRGYICGSGWKQYQESRSVCGHSLPDGLEFCGRLPEPLLTPTTKDDVHDAPLSLEETRERVGEKVFEEAQAASFALFERGSVELQELGILLADTKFEFGLLSGQLMLIDEALTPDSSRFWPREHYQPGRNQPSYDKQILRDHLETLDWDKKPPAPELGDEIVERLASSYLDISKTITGKLPEGISS